MKTIEIPREQWRHFCERLTELHRGAMVTIKIEESEGGDRILADQEPLQSVLLDDRSDDCNDIIIVETSEPDRKGKQHRVVEPVYVRLKNGDNDRYNHLHILAESGSTMITLNPGFNPALAREFAYTRLVHR